MEKLVQVKSESELKPGLRIVLKSCRLCRQEHRGMLLRSMDFVDPPYTGWTAVPHMACDGPDLWTTFDAAIPEGRLFRSEDLDDDDENWREAELRAADLLAKRLQPVK